MSITITLDGRTVKTSRNLRGILDYARIHPVVKAVYRVNPDGINTATFTFRNGATSTVDYASLDVFRWFLGNRRSWGKYGEWVNGPVVTFTW